MFTAHNNKSSFLLYAICDEEHKTEVRLNGKLLTSTIIFIRILMIKIAEVYSCGSNPDKVKVRILRICTLGRELIMYSVT